MQRFRQYALWLAIGLIALVCLPAGLAKLASVPELHHSFEVLGLPKWFGYFIGASEALGAIALFIKPLRALAAAGIAIIMVGATAYHIAYPPMSEGIAAVMILLLSVIVAWRYRRDAFGVSRFF